MSDFDLNGANGVAAEADEDSLVFDLNQVEEPSFELLPKGTYNAVIEEMEYTYSSAGNPMLKAILTITDGEFAERKLYDFYVLGGEGAKYALPKIKQLLARVCPDYDISTFKPRDFADSGIAVGRQCQIKVKISTQTKGENKGEKRNQIQEVFASAGSANSFLG